MDHELKIWPDFYERVIKGEKPFEVRQNDRGFQKGDTLTLREWDPAVYNRDIGSLAHKTEQAFTGRHVRKLVTFVLPGGQFGVEPGHVVMGLTDPPGVGAADLAAAQQQIAQLGQALKAAQSEIAALKQDQALAAPRLQIEAFAAEINRLKALQR